jgi:hypothetical protein
MKDLFRGSPFNAYCVNSTPTNVQLFRMALFRSIYDLRHPITPCHNLSLETITCFYE